LGSSICRLKEQGVSPGSCLVQVDGKRELACTATLKHENNQTYRLITAIHLSRPENYLSIVSFDCFQRKCSTVSINSLKNLQGYAAFFTSGSTILIFEYDFKDNVLPVLM